MVARPTKLVSYSNLFLGILWLAFAIVNLFISGKLIIGSLYLVISVAYLLMARYYSQRGIIQIEDGVIVKYEFLIKPKRMKIADITWAKCVGSYYTFKGPHKKMAIELSNVRNEDIPAFEKVFKDIVMSVSPYKVA